MNFLAKFDEAERDAYQHFVDGPGLRILEVFLKSSMAKKRMDTMDRGRSLEEIRFLQGEHNAFDALCSFLEKTGEAFKAPVKEDNS